MSSIKDIKNRINSVGQTRKITNAMYLIASTKLRNAKNELEATRPFFESLKTEIKRVFREDKDTKSIYFGDFEDGNEKNEKSPKYAFLVITADKGLAGAYNHSVLKTATSYIEEYPGSKLYVVGEVGRNYFYVHGIDFEMSFGYSAQNPTPRKAGRIADILLEDYENNEVSGIFVIYTDMKNSLSSEVKTFCLLPLDKRDYIKGEGVEESEEMSNELSKEFEYVPDKVRLLDRIVPMYVSGFIYSALVDSFCSEQNARMMAMDMADENAEELLMNLKKQYNHLRQNAITREITEVAAGAKAKKRKLQKKMAKRRAEEIKKCERTAL